MSTHAATGRPKVNGEQVNQETADTQSKDKTKDANTLRYEPRKSVCFKSNPMKKEMPKGLGDQKDTNTAREIPIYANRMPTHAAAGRPKVNEKR